MIYADYDYYANSYFGRSIQEDDFPRFALRASQYIDYITMGKAEARADLEAVKMCCCALAEKYQSIEMAKDMVQKSLSSVSADGSEVQSESVGSWSRSYRSIGDISREMAEIEEKGKSELYRTAQQHLAPTGILYRGGRCCR